MFVIAEPRRLCKLQQRNRVRAVPWRGESGPVQRSGKFCGHTPLSPNTRRVIAWPFLTFRYFRSTDFTATSAAVRSTRPAARRLWPRPSCAGSTTRTISALWASSVTWSSAAVSRRVTFAGWAKRATPATATAVTLSTTRTAPWAWSSRWRPCWWRCWPLWRTVASDSEGKSCWCSKLRY